MYNGKILLMLKRGYSVIQDDAGKYFRKTIIDKIHFKRHEEVKCVLQNYHILRRHSMSFVFPNLGLNSYEIK